LLDELVIVSISPVPKLDPGPVSYCQADDGPLPAAPLKSSLNTVDQPDGGPGTALVAAAAGPAADTTVSSASAGATAAANPMILRDKPAIEGNLLVSLTILLGKFPICRRDHNAVPRRRQ
jgi:hypothetical protein